MRVKDLVTRHGYSERENGKSGNKTQMLKIMKAG
jgi:hypothetical protein